MKGDRSGAAGQFLSASGEDTTDPAVAARLIDRIAEEVGPPDVLVNTIGAFHLGDALATTPETLRLMIDVNLATALWLSRAVAPHMQQQGSGVIAHVSARPGIEPAGGMAAYSVSKAADSHRIPAMRAHLAALDHGLMDPAPALYTIRINGHLGAMMLSAFPEMASLRDGAETVLSGLLDRSALHGVLAEIDALGLDLLQVRQLTPDPE